MSLNIATHLFQFYYQVLNLGLHKYCSKKLPSTVANNIKQKIQRMPKPTTLTKAIVN